MGVQVEKSNQKLVSKHGQKLNQHENTSPESTKSGSTESASPARNQGKISQPLKHFKKSEDDERSTKVRGKVGTYFPYQTAVSVATAPSACVHKATFNTVIKDMEHKKIHPGYYTTTYKEGPEGKGKKDSFVTEEHREEIKTENEMFEPAGFKQEKI